MQKRSTDRIANNTNSIAQFAKENNTMKTFTQFACRAAATFALTGILALSHSAAKADVVVDDWIQPSHATGVAAGTTELQLKLYNSDNYSVSGLKVKVTFERTEKFLGITIVLGSTTVQTSAISMTAYQDKWIAVNIPTKTSNNLALLNDGCRDGRCWPGTAPVALPQSGWPICRRDVVTNTSAWF